MIFIAPQAHKKISVFWSHSSWPVVTCDKWTDLFYSEGLVKRDWRVDQNGHLLLLSPYTTDSIISYSWSYITYFSIHGLEFAILFQLYTMIGRAEDVMAVSTSAEEPWGKRADTRISFLKLEFMGGKTYITKRTRGKGDADYSSLPWLLHKFVMGKNNNTLSLPFHLCRNSFGGGSNRYPAAGASCHSSACALEMDVVSLLWDTIKR